jgi:hypothetical protein
VFYLDTPVAPVWVPERRRSASYASASTVSALCYSGFCNASAGDRRVAHDPMDVIKVVDLKRPPSRGPGSGKEAWVRYALELSDANAGWMETVEQQSAVIRELKAEIELLHRQVASRKPKGGRPRVREAVVEQIEADIAAGKTDRPIAVAYGVSHVTVFRIRRRMQARERLAEAEVRAA